MARIICTTRKTRDGHFQGVVKVKHRGGSWSVKIPVTRLFRDDAVQDARKEAMYLSQVHG